MELRHLRCFLTVAEELHFTRAAERLHIDQSPLSRTIKKLEEYLGTPLFARTTRSTQLTRAGERFLEHVPKIFVRGRAGACQYSYHHRRPQRSWRVALSDGVTPARFSALMTLCRKEDPELAICFEEVPFARKIKGLLDNFYDLGSAQSDEVGEGILAEPAWHDPLHLVISERHPLLAHARVPIVELGGYPLVMGDAHLYEGYNRQIGRLLTTAGVEPLVSD